MPICEQTMCVYVCVFLYFPPSYYIQLLYYTFWYKIFHFPHALVVCVPLYRISELTTKGLAPAAMHTFQRILEQNVSNKLAITGICKSMRKLGQWSRLHLLMSR